MTMTPVEGQDWIYDRFIVSSAKNVAMFEVNITDNPHLNKQALALLDDDLDDDEKKIRREGLFVPKGGLVLREFDYNRHVIPGGRQVPITWKVYESVDHGFNAPTAILWHAVSPKGNVVTFKEHYQRQWVIRQHAEKIKQVRTEIGRMPELSVCDPSMSQRRGESERGLSAIQVYQEHGIRLMQAKRDVDGRINKMNEYLKYNKWHITEDCPNTIKEARGYAFKIYNSAKIADRNNVREEPNKKNDHAMDSAGYFFNFMPRISPQGQELMVPGVSFTEFNKRDFPWEVDSSFYRSPKQSEYGFGEYE
jgi:PBSX family phage terminase large subunit